MYKLIVQTTLVVTLSLTLLRLYLNYQKSRRRISTNFQREEEVVVIVGASSGIGRQLALDYAYRCKTLILVARRIELLNQLKNDIEMNSNVQVQVYQLDITEPGKFTSFVQFLQINCRRIDTLILNSGILSTQLFQDYITTSSSSNFTEVDQIFHTNCLSFIKLTAHLLPLLLKAQNQKGNLIVVSSLAGVTGTPTRSLYSSTKFALHGFFQSLRVELKGKVQVGIICLGTVDTDLRTKAIDTTNQPQLVVKGSTKGKLSVQRCADFIINCSDSSTDLAFLPTKGKWIPLLSFFFPELIDGLASRKYGI